VRRRVARKVFESHHRGLIEYLAQRSTDAREISETFRFRGAERLYHALAADRGAVVAAAHTGSWELAGLALARLGFRLHVVTGTQFHPLLSAGARRIKEARNIRVSTPADGFAPLLRTLREGGLVVLLVDGDVFQRSVPAPFFGRPTPFPVGPAILARRARAPLLHAHAERDGQGRHVIVFDGQDESDSALGVEEDLHRMTRGVARALESAVATRVEQWCIFRRMWGEEDAA
jgi:KDO2-lipid IV(A) lauroyltransferase